MKKLAVIGGGSWGTALAIVLTPHFSHIRLWVYEEDLAERMSASRQNDVYLPGFSLPGHIQVTSRLETALEDAEIVLSVVPSHLVRSVYEKMGSFLHDRMLFVSATKGLENGTLLRMSEVIAATQIGFVPKVAVISGPTFAREVAHRQAKIAELRQIPG